MKRLAIILSVAAALCPFAQAQYQTQAPADSRNPMPEFRSNVVSRSTPAVSYRHRSGSTKIDFQGTDLMHGAMGQAKVASKRGALSIDAEFSGLDRPTSLGHEYLTYVLWAISPEGRPVNVGEVLVGDNRRSKLYVTTDLQSFAMIVTAEPYYAVRRPSNLVVLENVVRPDTRGSTESVTAKYELIDRGGYLPTGYKFDPVVLNAGLPLEFFEARNAIRIAQSAGMNNMPRKATARRYARWTKRTPSAIRKHENRKSLIARALTREVVEKAEDARNSIKVYRQKSVWRTNAGRERTAKPLLTIAPTRNHSAAPMQKPKPRKRNADAGKRTATILMPSLQPCGLPARRPAQKEIATPRSIYTSKTPKRNPTVIAQTRLRPDAQNQQAAGARSGMPSETVTPRKETGTMRSNGRAPPKQFRSQPRQLPHPLTRNCNKPCTTAKNFARVCWRNLT